MQGSAVLERKNDRMFEILAETFSKTMIKLSKGELNCLPYSRSLLDFFELRGKIAKPLVVRCVVFGRPSPMIEWWKQVDLAKVIGGTVNGSLANGKMAIRLSQDGVTSSQEITVPFRTLGYPHSQDAGIKTLGNYENGRWLGHLVVVCDNTVIDLTIGQLNNPKFAIDLAPPYLTFEADEDFLNGRCAFVSIQNGCVLAYSAFPDERSHEQSGSWTNKKFGKQLNEIAQDVVRAFEGKPDADFHKAEVNPNADEK